MENKVKYFVNVLLTNLNSGEILSYKPIQIIEINGFNWLFISTIIFLIAVLVILIVFIIYFYKNYKLTKSTFKYEVNDLRNVGSFPKTLADLTKMEERREREKYINLKEDVQNI